LEAERIQVAEKLQRAGSFAATIAFFCGIDAATYGNLANLDLLTDPGSWISCGVGIRFSVTGSVAKMTHDRARCWTRE
jgi:hypothetical protein